ncbi:DUF431-domain-containing protein, partial [Ascobolus immersus RN42]
MEPELGPWSLGEYITITDECLQHGGKLYITSVVDSLFNNLPPALIEKQKEANGVLTITQKSVVEVTAGEKERVCLLDPRGKSELAPEDGDWKEDAKGFKWFVFGGILGDDPPRDRTAELRDLGFEGRRLGPVQMTTDTAVRVTRLVVQGKQELEKIKYVDFPEIRISKRETTEMPFRYVVGEDGQPVIPPRVLDLIKNGDM